MAGRNDDFEEVRGLLFGAGERFGSARATVVHKVHADVAEEANRRFVDWTFAHNGGFGIERENGGEWRRRPREDFYRAYEDTERLVNLWHERPDRWREEWRDSEGKMLRCVVFGGASGPRWVYEPHTAIHDAAVSEPWPRQTPHTELSFMLDPSEDLFSYALLDDATVHRTGRTARVVGREATGVLVATISWGYPPDVFHGYDASMEGTTDHILLVDREIGTLLRVAARLDGREFRVAEVKEVFYDEGLAAETFRLALPGVEFR